MSNPCNGIFGTLCVPNRTSKSSLHSFDPNVVPTVSVVDLCSPHTLRFCNGYDCGVYVMAFMDVLSIKTDGLHFHQDDVHDMRDLCLLSIVDGKIAHFLDALQGL